MTNPIDIRVAKLEKLTRGLRGETSPESIPTLEAKLIQKANALGLTKAESSELSCAMLFLTVQEMVFSALLEAAQNNDNKARSLHIVGLAAMIAKGEKQFDRSWAIKKSMF